MLKIGNQGLNIPSLLVTADWSKLIASDGRCTISVATLDALADQIVALGTYDFAPTTITRDWVSVSVTEPPSAETRYLVATSAVTSNPVAVTIAKQPKFVVSRVASVAEHRGTFIEFKFGAYLQAAVRFRLIADLAATRPQLNLSRARALAQLQEFQFDSSDALTPVSVLVADGTTVKSTAPAATWPDPSTRTTINVQPVAAAMADILAAGFPADQRDQVRAQIVPRLNSVLETFSAAVDLGAVCGRTLSEAERAALAAGLGSAFALPLMVLNVIGEHSRVFSISAFYDAVLAVAKGVPEWEDAVIDVENTPRTVGEFVRSISGVADEAFIRGIDAFYRGQLTMTATPELPYGVGDELRSLHPILTTATVTGPRNVP